MYSDLGVEFAVNNYMREHSGAIAAEGSASDSDPLGSGSNGLKYWRRDILDSHLVNEASHRC